MANILRAFKNLVENPILELRNHYDAKNRANNMGDALEGYIKDIFSNSINLSKFDAHQAHQEVFAYLGNQNNPPDMILKGGDSIEVKKIESINSGLQLNSSYPKDKLYSDSNMITSICKESDGGKWDEKDIIYAIGVVKKNHLQGLWFVYGDCYAANSEVYERIRANITKGIEQSPNVELANTKELARVNKVDPLGVTYLRVRGMWGIDNPVKVYDYLNLNTDTNFFSHLIMSEEKFLSINRSDREALENLDMKNLTIKKTSVHSPNNPAKNIKSVVISFTI